LWGNFPSVSYWRKNLPQNKQFRHNVYQKYLKIKKKLIGGNYCQELAGRKFKFNGQNLLAEYSARTAFVNFD
jgi:hypothetical protein